jgi:hypothetical protein
LAELGADREQESAAIGVARFVQYQAPEAAREQRAVSPGPDEQVQELVGDGTEEHGPAIHGMGLRRPRGRWCQQVVEASAHHKGEREAYSERIHRSNLVGMGILPLEYEPGQNATTLGLTGEETYSIHGLVDAIAKRSAIVCARRADGSEREFRCTVRIDTPQEREYYRHGGILQYVLRQLLGR